MAITGAGARLHAQDTSSISLLYDFEELEGELDYLTHVVALTFYPAVSGDPVTLGAVESNFKIYISQCVKNQKSYFSLYMYMCVCYIYIYILVFGFHIHNDCTFNVAVHYRLICI